MRAKLEELFGADLRSLAVLRIGLALIILVDLVQRSSDLILHYTDFGLLPRADLLQLAPRRSLVSVHLLSGVWQVQALLFVAAGICALALLVGYRTRLATVASWFLFISLNARNPMIVLGADVLIRVVLFWAIFLPLGARYSVDSALLRGPKPRGPGVLSAATVAYFVQIVLVYWFTALRKSDPEWRSEGTALYYALSLDHLTTPFGHLLLEFPALLKALTYAVLWLEIVGPLLLFSPVLTTPIRSLTVLAFVLMHAGIGLTLRIGLFPWISALAMLVFLPSRFWDGLRNAARMEERSRGKIYYDETCGFCARSVYLIKDFLLLPGAVLLPAQADPSVDHEMRTRNFWVVVDRRGNHHFGFDGVVTLVSMSPLLWPLAPLLRLSWIARLGEGGYRLVARHRTSGCPVSETPPPSEPGAVRSRLLGFGVVALLLYVFLWNLAALPTPPFRLSEPFRSVGYVLRLDQTWSMFAPSPLKDDGWYVIPGRLRNGEVVDLFRNGGEVRWGKPDSVAGSYPNTRWRRYMMILPNHLEYAPSYARYLCRNWNRTHDNGSSLEELEIVFVLERTLPDYRRSEPRKVSLYRHTCADRQGKGSPTPPTQIGERKMPLYPRHL